MGKTAIPSKNIFIIGIPMLLIASMILLAQSPAFNSNSSTLSIGITVDLLLTTPLIYFLLIRKSNIPKTTVVPIVIIGVIVCSVILPKENQYYLNLFKTWALPLIELSILTYVIYNVHKAAKRFKSTKTKPVDFYTQLKEACYEILPKAWVTPVVTEIAVFYYGFLQWKKRKLNKNEFSYHKNSGTIALLIAIIFLIVIETIVFHLLLSKWSDLAANILTFLSVYSALQIFGFLKSMSRRPIIIEENKLLLRYGIMSETIIDISEIENIEVSAKEIEFDEETRKLSILGNLESHNIIIRLNKENTLFGIYGRKKDYKNIALYVDENKEFRKHVSALQQRLTVTTR
ncbi:hypothetical protein [Gramella sp. KN1008]|uniref:hypothetical protein n=1 Tax=Gramella sp. KN1008 TaxID=2529298 RepID=UPI00103A1941|nr:hypothetical protein [Gramella sp. KN1008]TBW28704.1 hypothetical protein EZJ28_08200 [Gramella sp. KN1008]